MKKRNNFHSVPLLYLFNFVFFFVHIVVSFFYGLFVWPVKKLINFYNFLIQVNIVLRINKKIKNIFETNLKYVPCETNLGSGEIKNLLKSFNYFENKKNHPEIAGSINEDLCTFDYNYRGIYLNITKSFKKKAYLIEMKVNDKSFINIERIYSYRKSSKYNPLWF